MLDAALLDGDVAAEALAGLTATPKRLPPKLFYDAAGVALFGQITRLPEYYLTRTELALLARIGPDIVALAPAGAALIEWGASDETKARILLDLPLSPFAAYVPVDVAGAALGALKDRMGHSHPGLAVHPVCGDFLHNLHLPAAIAGRPRMGFFPGSTIGNFEPAAAIGFLRMAGAALGPGACLVVGADLRKDAAILLPAYDDPAGITAAFNLNVLARLNREAGADFDLDAFVHRAVWNDRESRIEMHLESLVAQTVLVAGQPIHFTRGETIHTENSYKHAAEAFRRMAREAGFTTIRTWSDPDALFAVYALRFGD